MLFFAVCYTDFYFYFSEAGHRVVEFGVDSVFELQISARICRKYSLLQG